MALIAISGKKQSGKDTVGRIIQILTDSPHFTNEAIISFLDIEVLDPKFSIKKFADPLKDILCILLGCTREQLEDEEFKNTELPEEWWYYELTKFPRKIVKYNYYPDQKDNEIANGRFLVKPTPRTLLQLLGTEAGRDVIHPDLWVNALFSKYHPAIKTTSGETKVKSNDWVISDLRFPNELKAVEDRGGITIRVNRPKYADGLHHITDAYGKTIMYASGAGMEEFDKAVNAHLGIVEHISETALDDAKFDFVIDNRAGLDHLINQVRGILTHLKLL